MSKQIIVFIIPVLIIGIIGAYWILTRPSELKPVVFEEKKEQLLNRNLTFTGGIKGFPNITKVIIDPGKEVIEGEKQTFSIWAEDPEGVEKVIATISTDKREELIELKLVEGTKREGVWAGSWITKNISNRPRYDIVFQVTNTGGTQIKSPFFWYSRVR